VCQLEIVAEVTTKVAHLVEPTAAQRALVDVCAPIKPSL